MSFRDYLTIGEVVQKLAALFAASGGSDLSVSKLRYLEDEGLIAPERTEGGYRKFSRADLQRIEIILRLQRERFLPLAVIKAKLDAWDRGVTVSEIEELLKKDEAPAAKQPGAGQAAFRPGTSGLKPLAELLLEDKIPESFVAELKRYGVIELKNERGETFVEHADVALVHAAWELRALGVEPRHLRMYATFADKEALTFEQFLRPTYRHKTPASKEKLQAILAGVDAQTDILKRRLLRKALQEKMGDLL